MTSSIGDGIYGVDNAGDQVIELDGEGTKTVHARATAMLAVNVDNLLMVGTSAINGTGNELWKSRRWRYGKECANDAWRCAA